MNIRVGRAQGVRDAIGFVGIPASRIGPNVVANGGFDSDTVWSKPGPECTISGGTATWDGTQIGASGLTQANILTDGKLFVEAFTVSGFNLGIITPSLGGTAGASRSADGRDIELVTAGGTLLTMNANVNFDGSIDDVVIREIIQ